MSIGQWYVYGLHGLGLWGVPDYYFTSLIGYLPARLRSVLSTLCALPPDGWLMWFLIVVDFIQFQIFVFIILQKMLYLYGCRDLFAKTKTGSQPSALKSSE